MQMRQVIYLAFLSLVALILASCNDGSAIHDQYKQIAKLSAPEMNSQICRLSPAARVDLYLYAVEERRPSDYGLLARDCLDSATTKEMVARLKKSKSGTSTFALIYALHAVPLGERRTLREVLNASSYCSKYFESGSPCHDLAKDIDNL